MHLKILPAKWHLFGLGLNKLNHWPQHHCDKEVSIEHTQKQSVIVTSQLLAAGPCIDDVANGKHLFIQIIGNGNGIKYVFMSAKLQESHE